MSRQAKSQSRIRKPHYSLQAYLTYHGQAASSSLLRLLRTPFHSLLTIGVIAIALALPAGLFVLLQNINSLGGTWERGNQISLYLKMNTSQADIDQLVKKIKERTDVSHVNSITPQQGLEEFEKESGFSAVLQSLPANPLPTVIEVFPKSSASSEEIQRLSTELKQLPQVDIAKLDMQWLQRLQSIIDVGERIVMALSLFFGIAVLLVIGNTIRLATEQQHSEIEVIKLIGGTISFIRRPFLYTGMYYGIAAGIIASLLIESVFLWLEKPIEELFDHYHSSFNLVGLSFDHIFLILVFGAMLGLFGSWFAVSRHIAKY